MPTEVTEAGKPVNEAVDVKTDAPALDGAAAIGDRVKNYALLLKPRVMSLVVFTGLAGVVLAPGEVDFWVATMAVLCIAVGAGASGAINMWYDRDIDVFMERTAGRPIPAGNIKAIEALWVGVILAVASVIAMGWYVNAMASALLAMTIAYYVFLYTMWLKRRTPQNIVIGGASGAFPPMIGWAAVTGTVDPGAWVLFLIIFMWTPPHFWALALFRCGDYAAAGVPMLPVVSGVRETKKQIAIYTVLCVPVTVAPSFIGMASWGYGVVALLLNLLFLKHAWNVWHDVEDGKAPRKMFLFSLIYLFGIFLTLLLDHAIASYLK